MPAYAKQPLASVLTRVQDSVTIDPHETYRQVTVRLFHKGVVLRGEKPGSAIRTARQWQVREGQVLLSRIDARNGAIGVVPAELNGAVVTNDFWAFAVNSRLAVPEFLDAYLGTTDFVEACKAASEGTTNRVRLQPERFLRIEVPLPSLEEQCRLVARIENLATRIQTAQKLRQQCSNDSDRLLISMAHRRDLSTAEKHRQGWRDVTLGDLLRQVEDIHRVMPEGTYPNLGIYSFGRGLFKKQPIQGLSTRADKLYRVRSGQFIYSRLFAFEGAYGWVDEKFDGYYVSGEYPVFDCDQNRVRPDFLHAHFKSPAVWEAVAAGSKGLGHRRQRVKADHLLRYEMQLPPMEWQDRIGRTMKQLELLNHSYSASAAELDALMPSILSKAFRGEL